MIIARRSSVAARGCFALDQLGCRLEQKIEVTIDLRGSRQHELRGAGRVRPFREEVQRRGEAAEPERILHGPLLGLHIIEVRQPFQVGAATARRTTASRRIDQTQPLGPLRLTRGVEGFDIGVLPCAAALTTVEDGCVVIREAGRSWPPRLRHLKRGERFRGPTGGEKASADLDGPVWKAPFVGQAPAR